MKSSNDSNERLTKRVKSKHRINKYYNYETSQYQIIRLYKKINKSQSDTKNNVELIIISFVLSISIIIYNHDLFL